MLVHTHFTIRRDEMLFLVSILFILLPPSYPLNILIPGGTGLIGAQLAAKLASQNHKITILARNSFLSSSPNRVSRDFGWLGQRYLKTNPNIKLRDWDGGDLSDIVGSDWVGWQEDALRQADVIINLTGGYTEQRCKATERLVRESLVHNRGAKFITLTINENELGMELKKERASRCESLVTNNVATSTILRGSVSNPQGAILAILASIINK